VQGLRRPFREGKKPDEDTELTVQLENTGLFEMIVGVLTTCHTQYT